MIVSESEVHIHQLDCTSAEVMFDIEKGHYHTDLQCHLSQIEVALSDKKNQSNF